MSSSSESDFADEAPKTKFLDLPAEVRLLIYRELLVDSRGVHLKLQHARHRQILFQCSPSQITRKWEHDRVAKKLCKGRSRPPSYEAMSGFVFRQHMGATTVFDTDEMALRNLGQITYLHRLQRTEQGPWEEDKIWPAILGTNKLIYKEAVHVLYSQVFSLSNPQALFEFLAALGPAPLSIIKEINIMEWTDKRAITSEAAPAFALLPRVKNLRRLGIQCSLGRAQDWAWSNIFPPRRHERHASACHRLPMDILANKVYRDMLPWLRPMHARIGMRSIERILRIQRNNFIPRFRTTMTPTPKLSPALEHKIMSRFWGLLQTLLEGDIA